MCIHFVILCLRPPMMPASGWTVAVQAEEAATGAVVSHRTVWALFTSVSPHCWVPHLFTMSSSAVLLVVFALFTCTSHWFQYIFFEAGWP